MNSTVGQYLAGRFQQVGMRHYFAVPGDYNLVLLDELLNNQDLRLISCCNELNAAYAADGYARATGGPSAIVVSGGPNTNSEAENELLHHTLGIVDYGYQREMFSRFTAESVIIRHAGEAAAQIDHAIDIALRRHKPVYLEIPCNLAGAATSAPHLRTFGADKPADEAAVETAVAHTADALAAAVKPALVAGVGLRACRAEGEFAALADAAGYAVATMANAKSFFPETHPAYIGTYWGPVSSPCCSEINESCDCVLHAGSTFTDYTTTGHVAVLDPIEDRAGMRAPSLSVDSRTVASPCVPSSIVWQNASSGTKRLSKFSIVSARISLRQRTAATAPL